MREISAFEAKNTLGSLLDLVQNGEEVVITRLGKPIARLIPELGARNHQAAREAVARIRARKLVRTGSVPSVVEGGAYKNEGRN